MSVEPFSCFVPLLQKAPVGRFCTQVSLMVLFIFTSRCAFDSQTGSKRQK